VIELEVREVVRHPDPAIRLGARISLIKQIKAKSPVRSVRAGQAPTPGRSATDWPS
jgi:hypothetical protein